MENLQRRASGVYVARLTVPVRLREAVGKRELIATTGTRHLPVAKLVAAALLTRWRQQLLNLDRAGSTSAHMHHDSILKIAYGHPLLGTSGHAPIEHAATLIGLRVDDLLRQAELGHLRLFHRFAQTSGYLVRLADLPPGDEPGSRIVPTPAQMPEHALRHTANGVLPLPADAIRELVGTLLVGGQPSAVLFDWPGNEGRTGFAPDQSVAITIDALEVATAEIERLRQSLARMLPPDRIEGARAAATAMEGVTLGSRGKMVQRRFSQAVEAYCTTPDGLASGLASQAEQRQRKRGLLLFSEFMGDLLLADIDGDTLRAFRDGPLKMLPGNANKLSKELRGSSMKETLAALEADGREWPRMSRGMQRERMLWLFRLFTWLHDKGYLSPNPASSLAGETGLSKAQRKELSRREAAAKVEGDREFGKDPDEGRGPFTSEELKAIFEVPHFKTGNGAHISRKNQTWYPFEYWLPLLGLFAGCRIKEACQLHLADIKQRDGVWCLDLNERTADKSLKNEQSARLVPLHPMLIELGLLDYRDRLGAAGYQRLFPELTYARSDARYAKEAGRKMSAMLRGIGMPRDNHHVFHCLRHNTNNALARVPLTALPYADEGLKKYIRYVVMGHKPGDDVNVRHYLNTTQQEKAALVAAMSFGLPPIVKFDIDDGLARVAQALARKVAERRGKEDMGPLGDVGG